MNPLRILHVASNGHAVGGMETNLETILKFHNRRRVQPYAAFLVPGFFSRRLAAAQPHSTVIECDAGRLRRPIRTGRTILKLTRVIRTERINAVISHGYHAHVYGGMAALLSSRPSIFWVHSLLREEELRSLLVRTSLLLPAAEIVSNSGATTRTLESHYRGRRRIRTLYYGIDVDRFRPSPNPGANKRKLGVRARTPVIVMPGRLQPWKGQEVFIRAARGVLLEFPAARFFLVGSTTLPSDKPYEKRLKTMIDEFRMGDRIVLTGHLDDVRPYLQAADIVVHASTEPEPFGLVLVEAMACGKTVVASKGGGTEEVIDASYGSLYPMGDDQALGKTICGLLRRPARLQAMGRRARVVAVRRFSASRMTREVEEHVRAIVDNRPAR